MRKDPLRVFFVGLTVLNEINHCNQAIFIVQKKDNGKISNNLMFEFGYSLAKFNSNKIHVFYADIDQNDSIIPSDIQGIWADYYKSDECEDYIRRVQAINKEKSHFLNKIEHNIKDAE